MEKQISLEKLFEDNKVYQIINFSKIKVLKDAQILKIKTEINRIDTLSGIIFLFSILLTIILIGSGFMMSLLRRIDKEPFSSLSILILLIILITYIVYKFSIYRFHSDRNKQEINRLQNETNELYRRMKNQLLIKIYNPEFDLTINFGRNTRRKYFLSPGKTSFEEIAKNAKVNVSSIIFMQLKHDEEMINAVLFVSNKKHLDGCWIEFTELYPFDYNLTVHSSKEYSSFEFSMENTDQSSNAFNFKTTFPKGYIYNLVPLTLLQKKLKKIS